MEIIFGVSENGTIIKAELASGNVQKCIQSFQGQYSILPSFACSLSESGSQLDSNSTLVLQNKNSSKLLIWSLFQTPIRCFGDDGGGVTCLSSSKCGKWLLRGLQSGKVLFSKISPCEDKDTPVCLDHYLSRQLHIGPITCISTNSFNYLATAGEDQMIVVSHFGQVLSDCVDNQSDYFVHKNLINDLKNSSDDLVKLHFGMLPVSAICLCDDRRLYAVGKDCTIKIFDTIKETLLVAILFPSSLCCLLPSYAEECVYVGAKNGTIYRQAINAHTADLQSWQSSVNHNNYDGLPTKDTSTCIESRHQKKFNCFVGGHVQRITSLSLSIDSSKLVSSSLDSLIIVWDKFTCQIIHKIQPAKNNAIVFALLTVSPTSEKKHIYASRKKKNENFIFPLYNRTQDQVWHQAVAPSNECYMKSKIDFEKISLQGLRVGDGSSNDLQELKLEIENLKSENAKWKEINNSLFCSSLTSMLSNE